MGLGVYADAAVRQMVDLLQAARLPEADVLDKLLIRGDAVSESSIVDGQVVNIALAHHRSAWARLIVGRYALSCELLTDMQLGQLTESGRPVDPRGRVRDPQDWRDVLALDGTRWDLWNTRVRELLHAETADQ
jgi:hypothetical protein